MNTGNLNIILCGFQHDLDGTIYLLKTLFKVIHQAIHKTIKYSADTSFVFLVSIFICWSFDLIFITSDIVWFAPKHT
jgi:hypothetical protein